MEPTVIRQEEKRTLPGTHRPVAGNRLRRRRLEGPKTVPRREPAWHRNVGPISLSLLLGVMPTARNAPRGIAHPTPEGER